MLGDAPADALTPSSEAAKLEVGAHDFDNFRFGHTSTLFDFIETRPVLPGHSDDPVGKLAIHTNAYAPASQNS